MKQMQILKMAFAGLFALALAACGSGGDDPAPADVPQVVIRATAQAVTTDTATSLQTSVGAAVVLDGSSSVAGSGRLESFVWTVQSRPTGSTAPVIDATSPKAGFAPDLAGVYTLQLRITDSNGGGATSTVNVTVGSAPAVPNVVTAVSFSGPSTEMALLGSVVGAPVTMDASGSADPAGGALVLTWTVLDKPAGSVAALTVTGQRATLTPDVVGRYRVRVRAQAASGQYADAIQGYDVSDGAPRVLVSGTVTASTGNGQALNAAVGNVVQLTGSNLTGSFFGTTEPLWALTSKPPGSSVSTTLTGSSSTSVRFVPDVPGIYVVQFSAVDGATGTRSFFTTTVTAGIGPTAFVAANVSPVASATSPSFVAAPGQPVTLRGGGSSDPAGGALTYAWRLVTAPAGSTAVLATPNVVNTAFTPDRIGAYNVSLTVTAANGLTALQDVTLLVGATQPTARVERATVSVLLGGGVAISAAASGTESGNPLTYSWAIDARPAASTAGIAAPTDAVLSFTPDVAGTYSATVTVADGPLTAIAPVTIVALSPSAGVVPLTYSPAFSRFNKVLGKAVIAANDPPALHVVDPVAGTDVAIALPTAARALSVSPSGRYAAVLHDNTASLVDLNANRVIRSFFTNGAKADVVALNTGAVVLAGAVPSGQFFSSFGYVVVDGLTGSVLQTLTNGNFFSSFKVVHADATNRLLASSDSSGSGNVWVVNVDPVSAALSTASSIFGSVATAPGPLWLSEDQSVLFNANSLFYRTTDFSALGTLLPASSQAASPRLLSLSQSTGAQETVALERLQPTTCCEASVRYPAVFKRWSGALYFASSDVSLPRIDGDASYGISIFHAGDNRRVVLVQTGGDGAGGLGLRYYLILR